MPMTHMFSYPLTDRLVLKRPITTVVKYTLGRVSYEQELTVQYTTIQSLFQHLTSVSLKRLVTTMYAHNKNYL